MVARTGIVMAMLAATLALPLIAGQPRTCGVFRHQAEYLRGTPWLELHCARSDWHIWPTGFFRYRDVKVLDRGEKRVLQREQVWGYRDHLGRLHRIQDGRHFRVLGKEGFIVYHVNSPTGARYHFSRTLGSTILPLTRRHLRESMGDELPEEVLAKLPRRLFLERDTPQDAFLLQRLVMGESLGAR
jgi:hypothetical protein